MHVKYLVPVPALLFSCQVHGEQAPADKVRQLSDKMTIKELLSNFEKKDVLEFRIFQDVNLGQNLYANPGRDRYWNMGIPFLTLRIVLIDSSFVDISIQDDPKKTHAIYNLCGLARRKLRMTTFDSNVSDLITVPVAILIDLTDFIKLYGDRQVAKSGLQREGTPASREYQEFLTTNKFANLKSQPSLRLNLGGMKEGEPLLVD